MRVISVLLIIFLTMMSCTTAPRAATASNGLDGHHRCQDGATCAYLTVPLDRGGTVPGTLRLKVIMADNADAPEGILMLLTGGPGQPGVPYFPLLRDALGDILDDYRLVMIDQRGTGEEGTIDCPILQKEVGGSDTLPPSAQAVRDCADSLGERRNHYTTADTVADLEDLRRALGVDGWVLDGVSYGSFTAQQYALTHPGRTSKLVLDSVVPQDDADLLYASSMRRSAWTLRTACAEQKCGFDPAKAVAKIVKKQGAREDVLLFHLLVIASIIDPKLENPDFGILGALRKAAAGDRAHLDRLLQGFGTDDTPATELSAGLHAATTCADTKSFPWGDASAPLDGRAARLAEAVKRMKRRDTWPFENGTVAAHGFPQTCLHWPPSRPMPEPPHRRLTMPVLLLQGDRDLSTPLSWAKEQSARTPKGRLVIIGGAGHSVQRRSPDGARAVAAFLRNS